MTEHRPTHLVFRCRRCQACVTEAHPDPTIALRRILEAGQLFTLHECNGVTSVADLIGTGPGEPRTFVPTGVV